MWKTSRSAAGLARAVLGGKARGGDGLAGVDLEAISTLTERLGELKGVAMKIGQIMGYIDPTLPPEMRQLLSSLQTQSQASPPGAIERVLQAAFGDRGRELLASLDPEPVAVASIGQVHRGRLADGREVAVKIQHPGIAEALRVDFGNAAVGAVFARLVPGGSSVRGLLDEARTAMLEECDYAIEATRQRTFARWFAGHRDIVVPEVIDEWCAPTVLTTEWLPGDSLDTFLAASPAQTARDRVGLALFEVFIGTLYRRGHFHADPHPGNFAITGDGRVVIYDFGCVRQFEPTTVRALAELLAAVRVDDADAIDAAIVAIGGTPPTRSASREHLRRLLRGFFGPLLVEGPHAIDPGSAIAGSDVLGDKRALLGLELPGALLFLLRLRFGLYAVLSRVGAVADWSNIERAWAGQGRAMIDAANSGVDVARC